MNALISFVSWLIGAKAGRYTAAVLLALAAGWAAYRAARNSGAAAEKARQTQATLDALNRRISTDDQLSKMAPDARRTELARWMRDRE